MSQLGRNGPLVPPAPTPHPQGPGTFDVWLDSGSDASGTTAHRNNTRSSNSRTAHRHHRRRTAGSRGLRQEAAAHRTEAPRALRTAAGTAATDTGVGTDTQADTANRSTSATRTTSPRSTTR